MPSRATRAAGTRQGTCASCTGGAITGITSGWDTQRQRLEPDAEQSARPVLRGALDSNVEAPTRRSLTIWFTDEAIAAWRAEPRTTRGGQPWYSELAILTALTLRAVFRLAYRQTEGLIGSLMRLLGLALPVPVHTTLSRRAAALEVPRPRSGSNADAGREAAPVHLLVDSRPEAVWARRVADRETRHQDATVLAHIAPRGGCRHRRD